GTRGLAGLLRPRRKRPAGYTAAEKCDEVPPPHGAYPKAKDHGRSIAGLGAASVACINRKSAGPEDADDRCPSCDPGSVALRHDRDYGHPLFHYGSARPHHRREVLFRSPRLHALALESEADMP